MELGGNSECQLCWHLIMCVLLNKLPTNKLPTRWSYVAETYEGPVLVQRAYIPNFREIEPFYSLFRRKNCERVGSPYQTNALYFMIDAPFALLVPRQQ